MNVVGLNGPAGPNTSDADTSWFREEDEDAVSLQVLVETY